MAIQAIVSNLQTQDVSPPSVASHLASDLNQMSKDLANSNWPAAEEDYVRFTEDAFNATEPTPTTSESRMDAPDASTSPSTINLVA